MADADIDGRIAVVGAGVSGLACAQLLRARGLGVAVFDKARGTGGRAATHRNGDYAFDSGAQYFTARDPLFVKQVEEWVAAGVAAEWRGQIVRRRAGDTLPGQGVTQRFVGVPGMSSISRYCADAVTTGFRVVGLERGRDGVALVGHDGDRVGSFDAVMLAAPAPQTAAIARLSAPALAAAADRVPFSACLALLVAFEHRLPLGFDGAFIDDSPLSWIAYEGSKPGRSGAEAWVLHGAPEWSDANFAADEESIIRAMSDAFTAATGIAMPEPLYSRVHRWRYALPTEPLPDRCLFDPTTGVGACGDWCAGPRIEGAFLSGVALAERVLRWLTEVERSHLERS